MNELQKKLLDLVLEIDKICKENDIIYYLDGGSAIGAIRHNGFIPWDDDIDIVFTRENWNKFSKVCSTQLPENRKIASLQNNPHYSMVYARYCDITTTNILITSLLDVFESGVFIDMFILDPIPNGHENRIRYLEILKGYCEYLNPYYLDTVVGANDWYDFFCNMAEKQGKDAVDQWMENNCFNIPEKGKEYYLFRCDIAQYLYKVKDFGIPRYVNFEGEMLPVPCNVEDYLRTHYGFSWYEIPKKDDQSGHNVVINLDVPYSEYRND